MDVALRIRELMTDRDIKNKTVAGFLGLGESTFSGYVRGARTIPFESLVKLADLFQVSADYLLGRTDAPDIPLRLSSAERRLILELRTLSPDQKAVAAQTVQFMAEQNRR